MPEVSPGIDDTKAWTLYTDGAASLKGAGAGLVLTGPNGVEYAYTLRLTFSSTNNEAEYEALLAGLHIARRMNVLWIEVKVDSKLVASQVNGTYEANKGSMIKYRAKAKEYISEFKTFSIENIPRGNNQKADVLSKLATVPFHHLTKEILVEVLSERSTEVQEVQTIVEEDGDNWITLIIKYLEEGIVPSDKNKAQALRAKIGQYTMESGVLFKKGYLIPMLRCVGPLQANYVIWEIHMGSCGMHVGPRAVVRKAMRQGYYWPTTHADAKTEQSNGETPFSLTYESEAVIPAEIGMPSYQTLMIREEFNEEEQHLNLDLLQERREAAAIREPRVEDQGKLGPKWEGPYRVTEAFENGSYKL
ncbi:reverse transcriptase domain-containing protein [Tanacetum coccineum]